MFRLVLRGMADLVRHPWSLVPTVLAVTLTVFLGGLFALFLHNLDIELAKGQGRVQFQIYWTVGADANLVARQWQWLRELPHVVETVFFTPDQALEVLGAALGGEAGKDWVAGGGPLPYTALVGFAPPAGDPDFARAMYEALRGVEGVAKVHYNPLRLDMARSTLDLVRRGFWPLLGLCLLVVALAVGNTVRLSLLSRREEIEILRIVGATRLYIRLPLLCGGAAIGLFGGGAAMGLLWLVQGVLTRLLDTPPVWIKVAFLPWPQAALLVGAAAVVAGLASLAAMRDAT